MMCRITQINEENYGYYLPMLPADFAERIEADEKMIMFGIESFGMAAGAVMVRLVDFLAEITWFYVDERYRFRGVGSEALMNLMELLYRSYDKTQIAMNIYAGSDEHIWHLFDGYPVERTPLLACSFETSLGYLLSTGRFGKKSKSSISLAELDNMKLKMLCEGLIRHGENLVEMPIDPDDYLRDQSAVYMENDTPKGVLLFKKRSEEVEIALMASFANNAAALMDMMSFSAEKLRRFSEDTKMKINIVDERVKKLLKNLLGMEADDEAGFTKSERLTMELSYLDEARNEAERLLVLWNEFSVGRAS